MSLQSITGKEFETNVLEARGPILVDFWAEWCGPCKMLAPVLEELDADNENLSIMKVDIDKDENKDIAAKYNIMSIPTLILFEDGEMLGMKTGAEPKAKLQAFLDELLQKHEKDEGYESDDDSAEA